MVGSWRSTLQEIGVLDIWADACSGAHVKGSMYQTSPLTASEGPGEQETSEGSEEGAVTAAEKETEADRGRWKSGCLLPKIQPLHWGPHQGPHPVFIHGLPAHLSTQKVAWPFLRETAITHQRLFGGTLSLGAKGWRQWDWGQSFCWDWALESSSSLGESAHPKC